MRPDTLRHTLAAHPLGEANPCTFIPDVGVGLVTTDVRDVVWTPVWDPARVGWGTECLRLSARVARSSAILFDEGGVPFRLDYRIAWDDRWRTRRVAVRSERSGAVRTLRLRGDGAGGWTDGRNVPLRELAGCIDVDLWPTPFTNTLPIRRLGETLTVRSEIVVVYIRAPALDVSRARQAYTRLPGGRVRFESLDSPFEAMLDVDADGLVVDYPGLFRRLA